MRIKTLPLWIKSEALRSAILKPLTECQAEPLASSYVIVFEDLLAKSGEVNAKKLALDDKAAVAQVKCDRAGYGLDRVADRVSMEILLLTGGDRTHATYTHFFGDKPISQFKKAKLGPQLHSMRSWAGSLAQSGQPTLQAIVPELTAAIAAADEAREMKLSAEVEKRQFRDIGERKQFIDKVNAVCKSVHGELSKLPHEMLGLPNDFADQFFRSETSRDDNEDEAEEPTIESVSARIEELTEEFAQSRGLLEELKAKEVEAQKAAAALEADKIALAELQKSIAEQAKLAAELQAKIDSV